MSAIPRYNFHKTKYGEELLIDVVTLEGIRPYIRKHPVHRLSYYDITFITKDSGNFSIDGSPYVLCRGDVVFSKPDEIRAWGDGHRPEGYALIFEEEFLLSFFNDRFFIRDLSYFGPNRYSAKISITPIYERVEGLIQNIIAEINNKEPIDKHILRALLYEMLMLLNREYSKYTPAAGKKPRNRYIDDFVRLADKDFRCYHDTGYYANELCISPNYLNEVVHKSIGMSPKSYILNKIIREAKILLSYTTMPVAEVAGKLNFENPSYFIRLFRKQTNLTPLQYRQSIIR